MNSENFINNGSLFYLGIETSCDDTAVALMNGEECLDHVILTHDSNTFGGVVPEYASRDHMTVLPNLIDEILSKNSVKLQDLKFISATRGPGLLGSLMVGVNYAKSLAWSLNIPWIGVNHLEAHALVSLWNTDLQFPFGILLVSGGHTCLVVAHELGKYTLVGRTTDDAVGEMFDKVGRVLGFENPAGPHMEKCATLSTNAINLPVPLKGNNGMRSKIDNETGYRGMNFSFSGLKTAAIRVWDDCDKSVYTKSDLCMGLQKSASASLCDRMRNAFEQIDVNSWVFVGGVASNKYIRGALSELSELHNKKLIIPDAKLCRDNGIMVAYTGYLYYQNGIYSKYSDASDSCLSF